MAVSFECDMPRRRARTPAAARKYLEVEITSPLPDAVRITKLNIELGDGRNDTKRLKKGCTSLMYACQQGLTDRVIEKVHSEVNSIDTRDRTNKNALHYSTGRRNLLQAAIIITTAPEQMEQADEDGFKPIHLAVIQGSIETVNLLLANKVDLNALDGEGHSVVHWATVCGETQILRTLLTAGANVKLSDHNGATPLHYAAQMCGYDGKPGKNSKNLALEILEILLKHPKTKVESEDKDGRQALLWAASCGSVEAIFALVKAGANAESCDKDGLSALHCSASRGHTKCIESLVKMCGVKTDLIDTNGCTALFYAVTLGHADATSKLLDLGADPNRQDRKGRSPAHCGCAKGQLETIKILSARGSNLWLRNAKGDLPLHEAASSGRTELVEWLLAQKPNHINSSSNDGRTVLHIAASNDSIDMCRMLIDKGAEINAVYRNMKNVVKTPLDCAMQKGFRTTAKFIQSHSGVPANKLRLSGRKPQAVIPEFDVDVGPIKISDNAQDSKSSKHRESDSDSDSKHHRKRRKCSHKRRSSSCSETFVCHRIDEPCEINRSKSTTELSRRHKSRRASSTTATDSSENSESDSGDDTDRQCCYHKKRQHRCYKKVKHKSAPSKSKDGSKSHHKKTSIKNRLTESENDEEKTIEKSTREKRVEIVTNENRKRESKSLLSSSKDGARKNSTVNVKRSPSMSKGSTVAKKKLGGDVKKKSEEKEKSQDKSPSASRKPSDEDEALKDMTTTSKTETATAVESIAVAPEDENIDTLKVPSNSEIDDGLLTDATYVIETDTIKTTTASTTMTKPAKPATVCEKSEDMIPAEEIKIDDMLIGNANGTITENVESKLSMENIQHSVGSVSSQPTYTKPPEQNVSEKDEGIREDDTTSAEECQPANGARSSEARSSFQVLNDSDDAYEKLREFEQKNLLNDMDDTIMLNELTSTSDRENLEPEDSGIEPSPRIQRNKLTYQSQPTTFYLDDFENRKPGDKNACNMTTVQQSIQKNIRRYYMERKIFQHLLELKSLQIRSSKSNEAILVKRAVEDYHKSVNDLGYEIGGTLSKYQMREYTFKNFELFLYETLKSLQKPGTFNFQNISEVYKEAERRINPDYSRYERALHCSTKSHRCLHATHAYTGIPCAAYIPLMNHHTIPKIGFGSGPPKHTNNNNVGTTGVYLPKISSSNKKRQNHHRVSIELSHGNSNNSNKDLPSSTIVLPSHKMDTTNKKYLVTFSLKEKERENNNNNITNISSNNNNVIESSSIKKEEK